jgi:hypothetical protein
MYSQYNKPIALHLFFPYCILFLKEDRKVEIYYKLTLYFFYSGSYKPQWLYIYISLILVFISLCIWLYGLCILLNSVCYVFLFICLCILIVVYALFCIFCFHRAN